MGTLSAGANVQTASSVTRSPLRLEQTVDLQVLSGEGPRLRNKRSICKRCHLPGSGGGSARVTPDRGAVVVEGKCHLTAARAHRQGASPSSRRGPPRPGRAWRGRVARPLLGPAPGKISRMFHRPPDSLSDVCAGRVAHRSAWETVFRPNCPIMVSRARTLAYSSEPSNDSNAFECRSTRKRCETGSVRWVTRWQHTRRWRASPCCPARRLPISPRDASVPSPDDDNLVVSVCMERGLSGRVRLKVRRVRSYGRCRALSIILGQRNSAMTGSFCFVLQSW